MTYRDAVNFLFTLPRFGQAGVAAYKPGLERMWTLLRMMGNPHESFPSIHVAGTNGKGSTASMVSAIGTAAGKRIGLHTSPHVFDFTERLRIDGRPAPHEWIVDAIVRFKSDFERIEPSFFEASVALSLLYFAERAVDLAVVEVGLGGRLDATNVLVPRACGVTHIGLDHTETLGDSLEAIGREKAGIAKRGIPLLSAVGKRAVVENVRETAVIAGALFENVRETTALEVLSGASSDLMIDLKTPRRRYERLGVGLPGTHQSWNAALAVRLAETVWPTIREGEVRAGLSDVIARSGLRGRCEMISEHPRVVADVAHNPDGWLAAMQFAKPEHDGQLYVLVGVMADKDVAGLANALVEFDAVALPVGLASPRGVPKSTLSEILQVEGAAIRDVADVDAGVGWFREHASEDDVLLVTGSHLVMAELHDHITFFD